MRKLNSAENYYSWITTKIGVRMKKVPCQTKMMIKQISGYISSVLSGEI